MKTALVSHAAKRKTFAALLAVMLLVILTGCSSEPAKPAGAAEARAEGAGDADSAFGISKAVRSGTRMEIRMPGRIASNRWRRPMAMVMTASGQCWRANFASPTARSEKGYTWSGSAADGAPARGINPGHEDSYTATNANTQIFDMAFLKIDSDQAAQTAEKHGGDKILQKAPDTPITFVCDWNHNTNELVWHVSYGPAREGAKLTVAVNASTGEFIRVEK